MNRHLSTWTTTLAGVALATLVIALIACGRSYDGRGKTERIVDCVHAAGYTTTVTQSYPAPYIPDESHGPPLLLSATTLRSPTSTDITVYASPADSPFLPQPQDDHVWWMRVSVAESTTTDSGFLSPRDRAAILNCTS